MQIKIDFKFDVYLLKDYFTFILPQCFKRYNTAHILLHSLSQQARNSNDKQLLDKCKS